MSPSRRNLLVGGALVLAGGLGGFEIDRVARLMAPASPKPTTPLPIARCSPLVYSDKEWWGRELNDFLDALPDEGISSLKKSLWPDDIQAQALNSHIQDVYDILSRLIWVSSNILTYKFKDEWSIHYHVLPQWVGTEIGVNAVDREISSTFHVEHAILVQVFTQLWDKLTPEKRQELLEKIDLSNAVADKTASAAKTGAELIVATDAAVYFTGFAFYTTMSTMISEEAAFYGVELPFAAYTGASSLVAFLTGPVGWTIAGALALAGVALAGRADPKKTLAFVIQLHLLKVAALAAAGVDENSVFGG
jgi:uncharacterized protein YaaW (UPF0174 family)